MFSLFVWHFIDTANFFIKLIDKKRLYKHENKINFHVFIDFVKIS